MVRVRLGIRLVDVPEELHLGDGDDGSVVVLLVAGQLIFVAELVEELGVAGAWEAEDLGDDTSHALVPGL